MFGNAGAAQRAVCLQGGGLRAARGVEGGKYGTKISLGPDRAWVLLQAKGTSLRASRHPWVISASLPTEIGPDLL